MVVENYFSIGTTKCIFSDLAKTKAYFVNNGFLSISCTVENIMKAINVPSESKNIIQV